MMVKVTGPAAAMAAVLLACGALAQGAPQPVQVGRAIEGRLDRAEVRHALRLDAGQTVRITARSQAFDTLLKLYGPTGTEPLAEDDDSGGGTTAELTFRAERAGLYQIAVSESAPSDASADSSTDAAAGDDRAYDLTVIAAVAPVLRPAQAITPNGDKPIPVNMAQCGRGCRFSFQATEGDRLIAETSADDAEADPVLELSMGGEKIAEDDDGGEGVNARIIRRIGRTGTYTLLARTLRGRGTFALAVSLHQPVSRPAVALVVGTPVTGRISANAEMTDEGKFYDTYTLRGRAGQRLVLDMESADFDATLLVLGETVLGTMQIASNDDAVGGGTGRSRQQTLNSRLAITFVKDGSVEVRAVSLTDPGAYTLRASEQAPAAR